MILNIYFTKGGDSCSRGGGNWDLRSLSLNTDYAVVQENKGILEELFIHEAAHAYSYLVLRGCVVPDGSSFRELAHKRYGDEEHLADIFVLYYGGKWTNYDGRENIPIRDRSWMSNMIDYCNLYEEAKATLSS